MTGMMIAATMATCQALITIATRIKTISRTLPTKSDSEEMMNSSSAATSPVTRVSTSPVRRWSWKARDSFCRWPYRETRRL